MILVLGSFTGIRIGVATAKAFLDSLETPCIGISSLESLAYNFKKDLENGCICSIINCNNDNCYFALFENKEGIVNTLIEPQSESIDNCLAIISNTLNSDVITFIGDGSEIYRSQIEEVFNNAKFADTTLNVLNSYSLALAGFDKYNSGIEPCELLPLYLKKPQAQRLLEEKNKSNLIK